MTTFNPEQALARFIELWKIRNAEFLQLPDLRRRGVRGDYEFCSSVDIELDRLYQEVHHHGFFLTDDYDPQTGTTCSRIEQMSRSRITLPV